MKAGRCQTGCSGWRVGGRGVVHGLRHGVVHGVVRGVVRGTAPRSLRRGAGLIEMMLATALSLAVLLIALAVLQRVNKDFIYHEQSTLLQENGRYAIDLISRAVRQAGYVDFGAAVPGDVSQITALRAVSIRGADNSILQGSHSGFDPVSGHALNGSDVLAVHFDGAGLVADGSRINCAGFAVASAGLNPADADRGWSIFHIAQGSAGEPELRCKYRGSSEWDSQAIVSGVENFQVLYGLDTDGDGLANRYLRASGITLLDTSDPRPGASHWSTVKVIKIALLMRAPHGINRRAWPDHVDLFGPHYAQGIGSRDPGSSISLVNLPPESRQRLRLLIEASIYLRNSLSASVPARVPEEIARPGEVCDA